MGRAALYEISLLAAPMIFLSIRMLGKTFPLYNIASSSVLCRMCLSADEGEREACESEERVFRACTIEGGSSTQRRSFVST